MPPKRDMQYEKVPVGDFVNGEISDVEYDMSHSFKGYQGKERTTQPGVRLVFKLDGCKYLHKTRWMKFSYHEKSGLYSKYLIKLVDGATPGMEFDLDKIKGMKVKTIWADNGDFQNIENIFPSGKKIVHMDIPDVEAELHNDELSHGEESPF